MANRLAWLLFGQDLRQQRLVKLFFISTFMYLCSAGMALYAVRIGVWQPWQAWVDIAYLAAAQIAGYTLVRGPWARKLSTQVLLLVQIAIAVSATDFAYALGGAARASLLVIFGMHITYSMLTLTPKQTWFMGIGTLASIVLTSATMTLLQPQAFPWQLEVLHMGIAFSILPVMLSAAVWVSRLRESLSKQNEKLLEMTAKLEVLAQNDELTGLRNRRYTAELMESEIKRAMRSGNPISVALLDLDHFKSVNDQYGHQMGDRVLQLFAQTVGPSLRSTDVLGRWGGEEFLLVLPETAMSNAAKVIDRFRNDLTETIQKSDVGTPRFTFSSGLTEHIPGETLAQTLERVDNLLYRAKHLGRNRTEMDTLTPSDKAVEPQAAQPEEALESPPMHQVHS